MNNIRFLLNSRGNIERTISYNRTGIWPGKR